MDQIIKSNGWASSDLATAEGGPTTDNSNMVGLWDPDDDDYELMICRCTHITTQLRSRPQPPRWLALWSINLNLCGCRVGLALPTL